MSLISEQQIQQFQEEGYFVTAPMWTKAELQAVSDEFDRLYDEYTESVDTDDDTDDRARELAKNRPFIGAMHTYSELMCEFAKSPIYLEACLKLIGPDVDLYFNQAVIKLPVHGQEFGWHQDSGYIPESHRPWLSCWCALDDVNEENGTVYLLPCSQFGGGEIREHVRQEETNDLVGYFGDEPGVPVIIAAGGIAIFSSATFHRSGANSSGATRRVYLAGYSPEVMPSKEGTSRQAVPFLKAGVSVAG